MVSQNGLLGMISGVISTILLQPFENIKMALMIPPKTLGLKGNVAVNIGLASNFIYKVNGWKGFYKGLVAGVFKSSLGCYTFFGTLRHLEKKQDRHAKHNFFHSFVSRIISTIVTNPLNIVETRFELADFHGYKTLHGAIADIYKKEGFQGYFSGCLTSCYKEGFFSGLYYMLYQKLKTWNVSKFVSGIIAGILATAITHPLQLIRARIQTSGLNEKISFQKHMIIKEVISLRKSGGWLRGLPPRLVKKPFSNTLTFIIFQIFQQKSTKKRN